MIRASQGVSLGLLAVEQCDRFRKQSWLCSPSRTDPGGDGDPCRNRFPRWQAMCRASVSCSVTDCWSSWSSAVVDSRSYASGWIHPLDERDHEFETAQREKRAPVAPGSVAVSRSVCIPACIQSLQRPFLSLLRRTYPRSRARCCPRASPSHPSPRWAPNLAPALQPCLELPPTLNPVHQREHHITSTHRSHGSLIQQGALSLRRCLAVGLPAVRP